MSDSRAKRLENRRKMRGASLSSDDDDEDLQERLMRLQQQQQRSSPTTKQSIDTFAIEATQANIESSLWLIVIFGMAGLVCNIAFYLDVVPTPDANGQLLGASVLSGTILLLVLSSLIGMNAHFRAIRKTIADIEKN